MQDARGSTHYDYDPMGRLTQITYPIGQIIEYTYDATGNRILLKSGGQTLRYSYTPNNQLKSVTDSAGTTTYGYDYDPAGNLTTLGYPNGITTDYDYDSQNRLTELTRSDADGGIISHYVYTLDDAGQRLRLDEDTGRSTQWTYDALHRLTQEAVTDPQGGTRATAWTYDPVGNRLTQEDNGQTTGYTYDANDRLLTETTDGLVTTYQYDANGNTTGKDAGGQSTTYRYDAESRLTGASTPGATLAYTYDTQGIRQSRTENGTETRYLIDPNRPYAQVLGEYAEDGSEQVWYSFGADLLSQARNGTLSYYHHDGLGSTRALSDAAGSLTDRYDYRAFGEMETRAGATPNDFLYTGEQWDSALGFYYLRARYMDPAIGRFGQRDMWAGTPHHPITTHRYLYANVDPSNVVDPSGRIGLFSVIDVGLSLGSISNLRSARLTTAAGQSYRAYSALRRVTFGPYKTLARLRDSGKGIGQGAKQAGEEIHHIIEKRILNYNITNKASSAKSVGHWWRRQFPKCMI